MKPKIFVNQKLANMKKLFLINAVALILLAVLLSLGACQKDATALPGDTTALLANQEQGSATSDAPLTAATTFNENLIFPVSLSAFVPCANGGAGETVDLSGNLHELFTLEVNGNHFHIKLQFQPQGISGLGEVSGDKYQATGGTKVEQVDGSFVNGQYEENDVNNFRIIGQGNGNNFLEHDLFHITVNANGTITSNFVSSSVECQ